MKKLRTKKLVLQQATVRVLDPRTLEHIHGGATARSCVWEYSKQVVCCSKLNSGCSAQPY